MSTVYKSLEPIDTIIAKKLHVNETAMFHEQLKVDNEPTEDNHIANKKYVDQVANLNGSDTILINANNIEVNGSGISNQVLLSSGTPGTASTFGELPLGDENAVTGTLNVTRGGTGASTFTSNAILKGNGTSPILSSGIIIDSNDNIINPNGSFFGKWEQINPLAATEIHIPNGTYFFLINEGAAGSTGPLFPPTLPAIAGQILYVMNYDSEPKTGPLAMNGNSGAIFGFNGNTWYRICP